MYVHGIRRLFDFPGYVIAGITMSPDLVEVRLERDKRFRLPCPACGGSMAENRPRYQTARDLPLGSAIQVLLVYPAIQGRCSHCGCIATIRPPGIHDHARATDRLMRLLCRLARYLPLSHAGEVLGQRDRLIPVGAESAHAGAHRVVQHELLGRLSHRRGTSQAKRQCRNERNSLEHHVALLHLNQVGGAVAPGRFTLSQFH